jgi:cytoskeletal protein CcmA (bactofilin family)
MRRIAALTMLIGLAFTLAPGVAQAEERKCRGTLGAITIDNLRVPQEASCTLNGTKVEGTVKVERDARLVANDVRVIGNVQAENARAVVVRDGSRIGGSVQVVQGGAARVVRSRVNADILYDENDRSLDVLRNRVGGDVQAFQNSGGVEIRGNTIDGNLQCKENSPPPVGGNNVVHGNMEDQCAGL